MLAGITATTQLEIVFVAYFLPNVKWEEALQHKYLNYAFL